jgi:hypothetical protein
VLAGVDDRRRGQRGGKGLDAANVVLARREGHGARQKLYVSCMQSVGVAFEVGRGCDGEGGASCLVNDVFAGKAATDQKAGGSVKGVTR